MSPKLFTKLLDSKCYNKKIVLSLNNNKIIYTFDREEARVKLKEKEALYKALKEEGDGKVCPLLSRSILFGVAYHNSGKFSIHKSCTNNKYKNPFTIYLHK